MEKNIKPVIDKVYPFDQAIQAYEHLSRGPFGKIVIKVADQAKTYDDLSKSNNS